MKKLLIAGLLLLSSPALAIDFSKVFVDDEGAPMKVCVELKQPQTNPPDCVRTVELTLARAARTALYQSFPDEQNLGGEEKDKRGEIARGITPTEMKLKVDELALVKRLIGKMYSPLVVNQAWRELDPK